MLILKLLHGRQRPDEELNDWGEEGPSLMVDWFHATYLATFRIGYNCPDDLNGEMFLDAWRPNERSGTFVDDLFYYDGRFYGDWELHAPGRATKKERKCWIPFDPAKAVFFAEQHWQNIPKEADRTYLD